MTFYTRFLEEPTLNPFESGWLEALGNLAWYQTHHFGLLSREVEGKELRAVNILLKGIFLELPI